MNDDLWVELGLSRHKPEDVAKAASIVAETAVLASEDEKERWRWRVVARQLASVQHAAENLAKKTRE